MSMLKIGDGVGVKGDVDIYAYANDDHLDTALRHIVPPLGWAGAGAGAGAGLEGSCTACWQALRP